MVRNSHPDDGKADLRLVGVALKACARSNAAVCENGDVTRGRDVHAQFHVWRSRTVLLGRGKADGALDGLHSRDRTDWAGAREREAEDELEGCGLTDF